MSQMIVNEADVIRAREALFSFAMSGALDAKRPAAWQVYGYPEVVTFERMLAAYERGGPAFGAVHKLLGKCWGQLPRIKPAAAGEEVTDWERKLQKVFKDCGAWAKLRDLDRRNMVGAFAAAILRVADGKKLYEPLKAGASRLVDVVPVYESQIRVGSWDTDENSETYGQPLEFEIETAPPTDRNTQARPRTWLKVHPSRVLLLAEGAVGDNFLDGVPLLRAGFNALIDLEKVSGGGAEGFLKNSARTIAYEFEKDAELETVNPATGERVSARKALSAQTRELNRNQDAAIVMQGGKANTLQTSMADPLKPFEVSANLFAASVQIPMTILFGQMTGRLASDEDRADFAERAKERQTSVLTPMLEQLVRRLQACGIVDPGECIVEWPDIAAPSDLQKLEHAAKMADIAQKAASTNGTIEVPFDANEIRQAAGYEPRADLPMGEGGDPPADPAAKVPQ